MIKSGHDPIWNRLKAGLPFVVAEIGKNFIQTRDNRLIEEYLDNAKKLVDAAVEAGVDAVKFQTHHVQDEQLDVRVFSPHFDSVDRYAWVKRNSEATPFEFWEELKSYCDDRDVIFFSTPMSRGAAMVLEGLNPLLWKVGSGDLLDFVLLDWLRVRDEPIIISSGMSSLREVDMAIDFLKVKTDKIVLLYCVSKYPCSPEDIKLEFIEYFRRKYEIPIGFSDHTLGLKSSLQAASMNAAVIEKHFSLSREFWGSDHKVSLVPAEMKNLCDLLKTKVLRESLKNPHDLRSNISGLMDENSIFRSYFRKSLVSARAIKTGELIGVNDLYAMRPQYLIKGVPSEEYTSVVGSIADRDLEVFQPITKDSVRVSPVAIGS